jgi:hypothetical protein
VPEIHGLRGGRAWYDALALPIKVRDRLVPETIVVDLDGDGERPSLRMRIEVRHGVPVCAELRLTAQPGGREIRPKDLRAIRIDSWIEQVVGLCSHEQPEPGGVIHLSAPPPPDEPKRGDARYKDIVADSRNTQRARRSTPRRPGRPAVPPDRLHKAADLYRRHADGGRPLQVVADVLGVSERTAARYIEKCRSDGLLPPRDKE